MLTAIPTNLYQHYQQWLAWFRRNKRSCRGHNNCMNFEEQRAANLLATLPIRNLLM